MKASYLRCEEDEDEDEEDVILNAAMLELGSVSDDDEASVEFTDGGSSEGTTESKTEDLSEAERLIRPMQRQKMMPSVPRRKKKSRETVPAAPLRDETVNALEALLFASGDAMTLNEIKRVLRGTGSAWNRPRLKRSSARCERR